MSKWTFEQQAAIELENANLLVSAAAGSGKTAVLVERISRLIRAKSASVDGLLVVTFTNAAAGEMRSRIETALYKALEDDGADRAYLMAQIKQLNRSSIKTFHAFCLDVLRQNFQRLAIDPNFKMINDSDRLILLDAALDEAFESAYEAEEPAFVYLVEAFSGNRDDKRLREMVMQLFYFSQSQPYPEKWLLNLSESYQNADSPGRALWRETILDAHRERIEQGISLLNRALSLCEQPGGPEPYIPALLSDREAFEVMRSACEDGLEALQEAVQKAAFVRIASIRAKDKDQYDESLIDEVKNVIRDKYIKKQIHGELKQFFEYKSMARYESELTELAPAIEALASLTVDFMGRFDAAKRMRNVMDFNDLEHLVVKLLEDDQIASQYRERFSYVFIDEYQDSSGIQEYIINRIKRGNNVFMVGDIKQSIYKFRLADPEIFLEKHRRYSRLETVLGADFGNFDALDPLNKSWEEQQEERSVRIDLKKNFRTRSGILDAVNSIFEKVMSDRLGEVTYDDSAKLYEGMAFPESGGPDVELNILAKRFEDMPEEKLDIETDVLEARAVADKIKGLIGTQIYFPKEGVYRPCRYRDIVVLIRSSRSWTPAFEQSFIEAGVPLYADRQTGYFDALEVRMLMDVLRAIDNPLQDAPFLTALRSPFGQIGVEAFAVLKSEYPDDGFYYQRAMRYAEDFDDDTAVRLKRFLEKLSEWRERSRYMPIDAFLWSLISEANYEEYVAAMPGGALRQANLKLLIDRATAFKTASIRSLSQFIAFVDQIESGSGDMGSAATLGEDEDVVRLMSIHKSKGLEFPVVILCGLGRKFNLRDSTGDMVLHKNLGIGLSIADLDLRTKSKTLPQYAMRMRIKRETLSEEMRILYVALTRPVDRLILYATVRDYADVFLPPEMAGGFLEWIAPAMNECYPESVHFYDGGSLAAFEETSENRENQKLSEWRSWFEQPQDISDEIDRRMRYTPAEAEAFLPRPAKISVSEKNAETGYKRPELHDKPVFLKELDAAQAGTATHRFLERLDFTKVYSEETLKEVLIEMTSRRLFTDEEAAVIPLDAVLRFLQSPLMARLKASKVHYKETPFVLKEEDQLVQGVIDLYFIEADGIVVVDYKTDHVYGAALDAAVEKYRGQVAYYANAAETMTGMPVKEKILYFLTQDRWVRL